MSLYITATTAIVLTYLQIKKLVTAFYSNQEHSTVHGSITLQVKKLLECLCAWGGYDTVSACG